jgi:predicted outer membrane repeat protein
MAVNASACASDMHTHIDFIFVLYCIILYCMMCHSAKQSNIDSNYAYEFGGGCNLEVGGSVIINNSVFSRNRAGSSGGGIRGRERLDLTNVLFDRNYAVRQGNPFNISYMCIFIFKDIVVAQLLGTDSANSSSTVQYTSCVPALLQPTAYRAAACERQYGHNVLTALCDCCYYYSAHR